MMTINVADDATHRVKLWWNLRELAFVVQRQQPGFVVLTDVYLIALHEEPRVTAVAKILRQAKHGDFVFVRFTLLRTELSAVTAFITEGVEV